MHQHTAARLHWLLPGGNSTWSKLSFDTSSNHWKSQIRSRLLGWERGQQPKRNGEQLIFGTDECRQKCLLGPSNKLDNTSTYGSSSSSLTQCCSSATNCSLWEMPLFKAEGMFNHHAGITLLKHAMVRLIQLPLSLHSGV